MLESWWAANNSYELRVRITIADPLSACLIMMSGLEVSSCRALCSVNERLLVVVGLVRLKLERSLERSDRNTRTSRSNSESCGLKSEGNLRRSSLSWVESIGLERLSRGWAGS